MKQKFGLTEIAQAGVLAALVCAASWLRIPLPSPAGNTAIHLGNVLCILSGLLMGPWVGGLAAGIGSALFDVLNPAYIASAPFTLVFKFFIGFFAGLIAFSGDRQGKSWQRNIVGGGLGSAVYIVLYLARSYWTAIYVNLMTPQGALFTLVPKALSSIANAVIAVIVAVPLAPIIIEKLRQAGLRK